MTKKGPHPNSQGRDYGQQWFLKLLYNVRDTTVYVLAFLGQDPSERLQTMCDSAYHSMSYSRMPQISFHSKLSEVSVSNHGVHYCI